MTYFNMENFEEWIINLPLQTLTDELKEDIIDKCREINEERI